MLDAGSSNGTKVNGRAVEQAAGVSVLPGDIIEVGSFGLTIRAVADASADRRIAGGALVLTGGALAIVAAAEVAAVAAGPILIAGLVGLSASRTVSGG